MNILFLAGLILVALGILLLIGQPKEDKRTKTGFEKNSTTSYGMCFILISIGAGLLYIDSKFFLDEKKSNVATESSTSSNETQKQRENKEKDSKESNFEKSDSIRDGDY